MEDDQPTWTKTCECGAQVSRWRGQGDVSCPKCGASFNAFGQRLRDDWRSNPSNWDEEISDLDGYEISHTNDY